MKDRDPIITRGNIQIWVTPNGDILNDIRKIKEQYPQYILVSYTYDVKLNELYIVMEIKKPEILNEDVFGE